mgnify:CR=1 FL=1
MRNVITAMIEFYTGLFASVLFAAGEYLTAQIAPCQCEADTIARAEDERPVIYVYHAQQSKDVSRETTGRN